jgi:hypothetical protein
MAQSWPTSTRAASWWKRATDASTTAASSRHEQHFTHSFSQQQSTILDGIALPELQIPDAMPVMCVSMWWSGVQVFRENMGKADTPRIKELGLSAADQNKDRNNWTQVWHRLLSFSRSDLPQ